jgi:hypothetical protein
VLYAALRQRDWPEIAMRLTAEEVAMFRDRPTDFAAFARDFIASHDSTIYCARKISFRTLDADVIEVA